MEFPGVQIAPKSPCASNGCALGMVGYVRNISVLFIRVRNEQMLPRYDPKYLPTKLRVKNLGVNVKNETNDSMNAKQFFKETESMVVGEYEVFQNGQSNQYFNLIVDHEGVAINTSVPQRALNQSEYALFVDGNVYVSGQIRTPGGMVGGVLNGDTLSNITYTLSNIQSPWVQLQDQSAVYYDGTVTIGNFQSASNTGNALNIVDSADRTVDHAQISIQNTQASQLRMGIIGTARQSPAIVNTVPGVPLEFHVGRTQDYFNRIYYEDQTSTYGVQYSNVSLERPQYNGKPKSMAPHFLIDPVGNVGIHTSCNVPLRYQDRLRSPTQPDQVIYSQRIASMDLHVEGAMFASNVLIWDADYNSAQSLDTIFARKVGTWISACNIIPGDFARGYYNFTSNTTIMGPMEPEFNLSVYGSAHITSNLVVDQVIQVPRLEIEDLLVYEGASFCNDVYMDKDLYIREYARLYGGIKKWNVTCNDWDEVMFQFANSEPSSINKFGGGISVPGQVGVGMVPSSNELNNMLVVHKNLAKYFEVELEDHTVPGLDRTTFIGHILSDDPRFVHDASLSFVTPQDNYNVSFPNAPQNFYFFPGTDLSSHSSGIVTRTNPPVLGIFSSKRVGINTYSPRASLDVQGDIAVSNGISVYDPDTNKYAKLGVWEERTFSRSYPTPVFGDPLFQGLMYNSSNIRHVGIHTDPDVNFGLVVKGAIKSIGGVYNGDGRELMEWYDSKAGLETGISAPSVQRKMFTYSSVGIGNVDPQGTLDVMSAYSGANTTLRLCQNPSSSLCKINFVHSQSCRSWTMETNNNNTSFMKTYNTDEGRLNDAVVSYYNLFNRKHQVIIGGTSNMIVSPHPSYSNIVSNQTALLVGGDLAVKGDVNITGSFKIMGNAYANTDIQVRPPLKDDDIFIGGADIFINPGPSKATYVGYGTQPESADAMFNVYQSSVNKSTICRFSTAGPNGLIDVVNANTSTFRFGILNNAFGFWDKDYNPFFTLDSLTSVSLNGERRFGMNTLQPTAIFHATQPDSLSNIGRNMLRLTRSTAGELANVCPEIELEKSVRNSDGAGYNSKRWIIRGPDFAYNQKLSLQYGEGADPNTVNYNELFTFTKHGQLGIGNTQPEFALDIRGDGTAGSIRLHSVPSNDPVVPLPQLVFVSGSSEDYGGDSLTDYRFYAHDNGFHIEQQGIGAPISLFNWGSNGNLGVRTYDTNDFTVNVNGTLNVSDTIYLNGSPLFSVSGIVGDANFKLLGRNIYILPENPGGVAVNYSEPTGNLFHIAGNNSGNLLVLDSVTPDVHLNYRTSNALNNTHPMYRTGMSNNTFFLAHRFNYSNITIDDSYTEWYNAWKVTPPVSVPNQNLPNFNSTFQGTLTLNAAQPNLYFKTSSDDRIPYTSLVGDNGGNLFVRYIDVGVGIGTNSPSARLDVRVEPSNAGAQRGSSDLFKVSNNTDIEVFTIKNNGFVGIGSNNPITPLHVIGASTFDGMIHGTSNVILDANIEVYGNSLVHGNTITDSDLRLKSELKLIESALDKVKQLSGYTFKMNNQEQRCAGLIAQEVKEVLPEVVHEGTKGFYGVAYGNMMGLIVEAIKELSIKVEKIAERLPPTPI